jgi:hypothetical protein
MSRKGGGGDSTSSAKPRTSTVQVGRQGTVANPTRPPGYGRSTNLTTGQPSAKQMKPVAKKQRRTIVKRITGSYQRRLPATMSAPTRRGPP